MLDAAIRRGANLPSEAIKPGSRGAVLRRSEGTCFSSRSDDEVGGSKSAIRAERALASEAIEHRIAPRAVLRRKEPTRFSLASDDEVGALQGAIRAERALASEAIEHGQTRELGNAQSATDPQDGSCQVQMLVGRADYSGARGFGCWLWNSRSHATSSYTVGCG